MDWKPRLATEADVPALEAFIPLSVRELQIGYYSPAQIEAALGPIFGVDRQIIRDGTYFVVEQGKQIIGCGGWSKRRSMFGSDNHRQEPDDELDPSRDPARIRAFFVHPAWARRGIGRSILFTCERFIHAAGFRTIELVATLAGEPLYASCQYQVAERYDVAMPGNLSLPVVRMTKQIRL
jgi:GNAT superfamily N-acetyltransferase